MTVFTYTLCAIAVCAVVTVALRAFPFVLFRGENGMPPRIERLAGKLPPAIIAVLVVYCLKSVPTGTPHDGLITLLSAVLVVLLHLWKRSILISIAGGTALYMVLTRVL